MGSYEHPLHMETMEGGDIGDNSDYSDTLFLFDETPQVSHSFVLGEFQTTQPNTQIAEDRPIVENFGVSTSECAMYNDKEDIYKEEFALRHDSKGFDSVDSYIYHQEPSVCLSRPEDIDVKIYVQDEMAVDLICSTENIKSDSEHFGSLDFCVHQENPLVGTSRPDDLDVRIHELEIMPVNEYRGTAIGSFGNDKGNSLCYLENVGSKHEDAVGSLVENVEPPMVLSSLATQSAEGIQENNQSDTEIGDTQQKNPNDTQNPVNLLEDTVGDHLGVDEEKQELYDEVKADRGIQELQIEETSCTLVSQLSRTTSDHPVEVRSSSPFLRISGAVNDNPRRQLGRDSQERNCHSGNKTCSNLVDLSRFPDAEERDGIKPDLVHASTCSVITLSPPRRSTRRNKWSHQKSETGKTTTPRGKTVNKKLLPGDPFLNAVRRKRTCPCARARSSTWGSLENFIQVKEDKKIQKVADHFNLAENQESHRRRVDSGKGRRQKTHASSSLAAKEKSCASNEQTSHVRLKVKIGGHNGKINLNVQDEVLGSPISSTVAGKSVAKPGYPFSLDKPEFENGTKNSSVNNLHNNRQFAYADRDLENSASYPGAHISDSLYVEKDLESTVTQDTSIGNNFVNFPRGFSQIRAEAMNGAICGQYSDPGTSPDSEVISISQDVSVGADALLTTTQLVVSNDPKAPCMELVSLAKQKRSTKVKGNTDPLAGYLAGEEKSTTQNMRKKSAKHRQEDQVCSGVHRAGTSSLGSYGNGSRNSSSTERHTNGLIEVGDLGESSKREASSRSCKLSGQNLEKSGGSVSARNRRNNVSEKRREDSRKLANKRKVKKEDSLDQVFHDRESHKETGGGSDISPRTKEQTESLRPGALIQNETVKLEIPSDPGISTENNFASEDLSKSSVLASGFDGQLLPLPDAWVRCDDCYKWRCISTELADSIEATNCRWICNENLDKAFADCSIPQEKSNAEINAELEITEFSGEEDASYARPPAKELEGKQSTVPRQAPWKPIDSNLYLHRNRKSQTIDEIMICHCKPPSNGGMGCGDECLNRMLNIECVRGTCPCGDRCSNQQFQKRKYAKLECFRCGKKGHGLQLLESVSEGDFLIEYVGEVLDLNAYEARQREYASRGQKHFYFMTLNGSEVIDACAKGNLGRFINHSCDPNCRTEKWMVNGEVCIGLFAMRNIKKGEELTFDYNYVRVFGAAAKRCVCGSSECRGYIGGDPLNPDAIVQGDSDEEFPEPVMVDGDGETEKVLGRITSNPILSGIQQLQHTDHTVISVSSSEPIGSSTEKEDSTSRSLPVIQPIENPPPEDDMINNSVSDVPPLDLSITTEDVTDKSPSPLDLSIKTEDVATILPSPLDLSIKPEDVTCKSPSPPDMSIKTEDVTDKSVSSIQPLEVSLSKDNTSTHGHLRDASSTITDVMNKSLPDHARAKGRSISDIVEDKPTISKSHSPAKSSRSSSSIKKGKSRSNPPMVSSKPPAVANKPKKFLEGSVHTGPRGVEDKLNELLDTDGSISKRKDAAKGYLKFLYVTASSGDNSTGEGVQSTRELSIVLDALLKTKRRSVLNDVINKNGLQMLHNIMKQNRRNFNRIPIIRKLLKILELLAEKEILTRELMNTAPPCAGMESFRESIFQLTKHTDMKVHHTARNFLDKWLPRNNFKRKNYYSDRDRDDSNKRWAGPPVSNHPPTRAITRKRKTRWDQPEGTSNDAPPGFPPVSTSGVVTGTEQEMFLSNIPVSYGIPAISVEQLGSENWEISPGIPFHPFPPLPSYPRENRIPGQRRPPQDNQRRCLSGGGGGGGRGYYRQQKWNARPPWYRKRAECGGGGGGEFNSAPYRHHYER